MGSRLAGDQMIGIGERLPARPSHTTVRTGPYTAVRRVKLRGSGEARQAEGIKEGIRQGLADRRFMTEPPRTEAATGDAYRPVATDAPLTQLLHAPSEPLQCFHITDRSRWRIHLSKGTSTQGV